MCRKALVIFPLYTFSFYGHHKISINQSFSSPPLPCPRPIPNYLKANKRNVTKCQTQLLTIAGGAIYAWCA